MNIHDLPIYNNPVGVMVSGGTDSALLLYLLLQKYKTTIQIFTIAQNKRNAYNAKAAIDVVAKCTELTENHNIEHHIFHRYLQNDTDFYDIPKLYKERGLVDKVFLGITANPPLVITNNFKDKQSERDIYLRDPLVHRDETPQDSFFVLPWINIDKKKIYEHYKTLGLLESLYPLTRSCELGYKHCGECWFCSEREWAFGKL